MKDFATKYIQWYDECPLWAKVLLCFLWAIPAGLYRFSKSVLADNTVGMILAVVLTLVGGEILWVVDLISLIVKGKLYWLDNINEIISTDAKAEEPVNAETPENDAE